MTPDRCPGCGCDAPSAAHAAVARLTVGDVDGAIDAWLLEAAACASCGEACRAGYERARRERTTALAARERYRARERRLQRRAAERAAARAAARPDAPSSTPQLPPAAAAALQRALARARTPR